jgi:hypothetical protein
MEEGTRMAMMSASAAKELLLPPVVQPSSRLSPAVTVTAAFR